MVSFQPFALVPMLCVGTTDRALCAHPQLGFFSGTSSRTRSVQYSKFQRRALEPGRLSPYSPMNLDSSLFMSSALSLAPFPYSMLDVGCSMFITVGSNAGHWNQEENTRISYQSHLWKTAEPQNRKPQNIEGKKRYSF